MRESSTGTKSLVRRHDLCLLSAWQRRMTDEEKPATVLAPLGDRLRRSHGGGGYV